MKAFLRLFSLLIFVFLTTPFIILLSIKTSDLNPAYLKKSLLTNNIYKVAATEINKSAKVPFGIFTANYIQLKVEKLIDDTDAWLFGKTQTAPVISFNDLSPNAASQIKSLTSEFKNSENKELADFFGNGLSLPIGERFKLLKDFSYWLGPGFLVIGGVMALCLGVGLFLSESVGEKFKWLGSVFLVAFFWNIIPSVATFFSEGILRGLIVESPDLPKIIIDIYLIFSKPIFANAIKTEIFFLVGFLIISIVLFIISSVANRTKTVKK